MPKLKEHGEITLVGLQNFHLLDADCEARCVRLERTPPESAQPRPETPTRDESLSPPKVQE